MNAPHLENFVRREFKNKHGDWWPLMSPRWLVLADVLRFRIGRAIWISNSNYALGRRLSTSDQSEHNVNFWDYCLAGDVFIDEIFTQAQARKIVALATELGFTGIGVYADTTNNFGQAQVMFHLGVRPTRNMGDPATWGRVAGEYTDIETALAALPEEP